MVFVVPSLDGGGAERVTVNLANAMVCRGYPVVIVITSRGGALYSQLDAGVRVVELAASGVAGSIPRLVGTIRALRPTALISIMDHTNLAVWIARWIARSHARAVFTTHVDGRFAFAELPSWMRWIVMQAYAWIYRRADARIAVSEGVAASLTALLGVPRRSIQVVYNPALTPRVHELALRDPPPDLMPRGGRVLLAAAGRLVPQKDFETLLRAFAIAVRQAPLQLVIMGEGPLRSRLSELVDHYGLTDTVSLPGFVENPFAVLRRSRVFVSSSRFEGFGIAIVEAMALGVPVVATDCFSGPAEILRNGRYGRLVPVGDAEALAKAVLEAVRDPGPVDLARSRAADFGIDTATERYLQIAVGPQTPIGGVY